MMHYGSATVLSIQRNIRCGHFALIKTRAKLCINLIAIEIGFDNVPVSFIN